MSVFYVYVHTPPNRERPLFSCYIEEQVFENVRAAWKVEGDGVDTATHAIASVLLAFADQWVGANITVTRLVPRERTNEEKLEDARRILRADYWDDVRNVVANLKDEIERGDLTDREQAMEWLEERVDGAHRVIYTYAAMEGLIASNNDGAYEEQIGSEGMVEDGQIQWSRLMYYAFREDILDRLGDVDELLAEAQKECGLCGVAFTEDDDTEIEDDHRGDARKVHVECPDEENDDDEKEADEEKDDENGEPAHLHDPAG